MIVGENGAPTNHPNTHTPPPFNPPADTAMLAGTWANRSPRQARQTPLDTSGSFSMSLSQKTSAGRWSITTPPLPPESSGMPASASIAAASKCRAGRMQLKALMRLEGGRVNHCWPGKHRAINPTGRSRRTSWADYTGRHHNLTLQTDIHITDTKTRHHNQDIAHSSQT